MNRSALSFAHRNNKFAVAFVLLALAASLSDATSKGRGDDDKAVPIWDMIPLVSQIKSIAQMISGDSKGAEDTAINFWNDGIIMSQLQSAFSLLHGNTEEAVNRQRKFGSNVEVIADSLPVVGHIKGAIHLLSGDVDHGVQAISQATSTTGALAGGLVGGPIGAAIGKVGMDALISAIDVSVRDKGKPHGAVEYAMTIADRDAAEHVEAVASLALGGFAGSTKPPKSYDQRLPPAIEE